MEIKYKKMKLDMWFNYILEDYLSDSTVRIYKTLFTNRKGMCLHIEDDSTQILPYETLVTYLDDDKLYPISIEYCNIAHEISLSNCFYFDFFVSDTAFRNSTMFKTSFKYSPSTHKETYLLNKFDASISKLKEKLSNVLELVKKMSLDRDSRVEKLYNLGYYTKDKIKFVNYFSPNLNSEIFLSYQVDRLMDEEFKVDEIVKHSLSNLATNQKYLIKNNIDSKYQIEDFWNECTEDEKRDWIRSQIFRPIIDNINYFDLEGSYKVSDYLTLELQKMGKNGEDFGLLISGHFITITNLLETDYETLVEFRNQLHTKIMLSSVNLSK